MGIPYAEVIGDPIAHSKSPLIHKFWLKKLGLEADYRATRVTAAELLDLLTERRADPYWRGCNVTIPHKLAVMRLLDRVEDRGVGAVNLVRPFDDALVGHNTDGAGIGEALPSIIDLRNPVCVIGAGGAARAALSILDALAASQVRVVVRNEAQGRGLVERFRGAGRVFSFAKAGEALRGCCGLINASPLGMDGFQRMPDAVIDGLKEMRRGGFVLDMVYVPAHTELLMRAKEARLQAIDGLTVLVGQAAHAFQHLFGAEAPRQHDLELRELLTR